MTLIITVRNFKNEIVTNFCSPMNLNTNSSKHSNNFTIRIKKKSGEMYSKLTKGQSIEDINNITCDTPEPSKTPRKLTIKNPSSIKKKNKKRTCPICYIEEEDDSNPLIQPCSCSGSMRYIHLKCLRHWLSSKILVKATTYTPIDYCTTYIINMVQCELCKENLPDFIRHKGTLYNILQFDDETNNDNYMVLDTVSPDHMNNRYRYIVKFDENNMLKVGRGLEVQLMLSDISVSRVHTIFRIVNGDRVVMEDFNSKFGTLVLLQCPAMEILQGQMLTVQVGRSYFEISIKEPFSLFGCCKGVR